MSTSNSERSYADRLARGRSMQAKIAGMTPAFAPPDPNIAPVAFDSTLNGTEAKNDEVSDAETTLDNATDDRTALALAIKATALRVKDHVTSNVAWKKGHQTVQKAADAVRGKALPRKPAATPPPGGGTPPATPPARARQGARTQQGYADVEKLFKKLIKAVEKIATYSSAAGSGLSVVELTAQATAFSTANDAMPGLEADLESLQRERADYYDGENGLRDKMKAIKKAVRGQYGATSNEYAEVKGIGL